MTLTVEDGTGLAAANAYASIADADGYFATRNESDWLVAASNVKDAALIRATVWLDSTYRHRFPGSRVNGRSQGLEWPRKDAKDASGEVIADDAVPVEIERATMEAALREVQSPGSLQPDVTPGQQKTLVAVEGIQWKSNATGGANAQKPVLHVVDGILASLIGADTGRLLRA